MDLARILGPRAATAPQRTTQFAESFGVSGMKHPMRIPNTRRALAVVELARDRGLLDAFRQSAMNAHWREGMDLENDSHLAQVARRAGLVPEEALAASRDPEYLDRVDAIREEAHALGVTGIPTFIFGLRTDAVAVVGCQPFQVLEQAALQAGARRK